MGTDATRGLAASDVMTRDVVCLHEDLDIHECEKILLEKGISGAPVIDTQGHLRGVVSKTDLVHYHFDHGDEDVDQGETYRIQEVAGSHVVDFNTPSAKDVMTPVPCVAEESASIADLAALMVRREVHRVVICRGRKVIGIVSSMDILRAIARGAATALPGQESGHGK
jgi:CBS domain-containing protein